MNLCLLCRGDNRCKMIAITVDYTCGLLIRGVGDKTLLPFEICFNFQIAPKRPSSHIQKTN